MKINRKYAFFIALLSLFYCVSLIQKTYAKYVTSATADSNFVIAKWKIKVNDQDVMTNNNFSTTITPEYDTNDNIANTVMAPTSKGHFDITVDGTDTDVAYNYTITASASSDNTIPDIKIISTELIDSSTIDDFTGSVTGTVEKDATDKTNTIRFYVEWQDGDDTTMDNAADTEASKTGKATFDINVNVIQKR